MPPVATLAGIVNWAAAKTALEAALEPRAQAYKNAAKSILSSLELVGQNYDAAVPERITTLAAWQAALSANRAAWEAALLPLYEVGIAAWKASAFVRYANAYNPDGTALPLSLEELPAVQAGRTLLDASAQPSVVLKAREPGLWGNQVSVRVAGGNLEARFGTTVYSVAIPSVGAEWRLQPSPAPAWQEGYPMGALLEQPAWAVGATLAPASTEFTSLTGGAGLVLSRLLDATRRIGLDGALEPADRALASQFARIPIKLVNVGGLLYPVPCGLPDTLTATGSIASLWLADQRTRQNRDDVQRFIDALP